MKKVMIAYRCALSRLGVTAMLSAFIFVAPAAIASPLTVTLLGTGTPSPDINRFGQSILVEAGSDKYLIDAGRGASTRLLQLGIPIGKITAVFLTHMHSDHLDGLQDLWSTGWIGARFGGRTEPMVIYGPKGTVDLTKNLYGAFIKDIEIRHADEGEPLSGIQFNAHDIEGGFSYKNNNIKITAFDSHHGEFIKPNFGYIIEFDGKKVVVSGDTTYDERVAKAGEGADLLLHEVAVIPPELVKRKPIFQAILDHHSTPEDAGRIFSQADPVVAAFTHIVAPVPDKLVDSAAAAQILQRAGTEYDDPMLVGEDLMRFRIGKQNILITGPDGHYGMRVQR